ncbi:MAG: fimbrial assembly protein [Micrococcales bacterium]|nr:fimbrial assembly protein [Micrococcales bacterium]
MSTATKPLGPSKSKKGKGAGSLVLPSMPVPQVNLLPPDVYAARKVDGIKRGAVAAVIAAALVVAAGYGLALWAQNEATSRLTDAQAQTARLISEQARYAEVPQVLAQQSSLRATRTVAFSTDVSWPLYISGMLAVLPENTGIERIQAGLSTPLTAPVSALDALGEAGIGQLTITARSLTVPDAGALVKALSSVQGFSDARASSVDIVDDADDGVFYRITLTVQLTADAMRDDPFGDGEG